MPPAPPPAVTLDLWHTLIYLEPRAEERYTSAQADLATKLLDASPRKQYRRTSRLSARRVFDEERRRAAEFAARGEVVSLRAQIGRCARRLGRASPIDEYLGGLRRLVADAPFRRAPGAREALGALSHDGYRLGLVSNTVGERGEDLRPVILRLGLGRFLDGLWFSDEVGVTKPDARIFHRALRGLGSRASSCVHVGDGWSDLEGARRSRLRGSVYYTGLQRYGPTYRALFGPVDPGDFAAVPQIRNLRELPALLHEMMGTPNPSLSRLP